MKKTITITAFIIFTFMFFLPEKNIFSAESGEYILKTRCSTCHGIGKIKKVNHDKKGWEKTVKKMMDKNGFGKKLNKAELKQLIDYLNSL